jgi:hypothetical protein
MTNWVILVCATLVALPACGPSLQQADDFTPKKVREIVLEHQQDDNETALPYHPCLGAFFFGQNYYGMRRRLLAQGAAL